MRSRGTIACGIGLAALLNAAVACDKEPRGARTRASEPTTSTGSGNIGEKHAALEVGERPESGELAAAPSETQSKRPPAHQDRTPATPSAMPKDEPLLHGGSKKMRVAVPAHCFQDGAPFELVIHFHGLARVVEEQWSEAAVPGALAVFNAGAWSRDYKAAFEHPGVLDTVLSRVRDEIRALCPELPAAPDRTALSAWSAGYTVVRAILRDAGPARIDAILLADGIHAALDPKKLDVGSRRLHDRVPLAVDVDPFVDYARLAVTGERMFAVTHSTIETPNYASTSECTNYVLTQLGLERRGDGSVDRGGFQLRRFVGTTAPDHIWQLHHMGETLFPHLRERWTSR